MRQRDLFLSALCACGLFACGSGDATPLDAARDSAANDATPDAPHPLENLVPTAEAVLSPGNSAGQDEDPSILRALDGQLYVAWYSNRNGAQPDGVIDREIFLSRSTDGEHFTDPPIQVTRHDRFSFYPSLAQDHLGGFHLAWWRMIPTPQGCNPDVNCTGTVNQVLYKSSADGTTWNLDDEAVVADGPGDWLPVILHDHHRSRLMLYFVSVVRDVNGNVDLNDRTLRIYVSIHNGTRWDAPQRLVGVNPDTSHNTFPHVVQLPNGQFRMTWTRYDHAASSDVLQVIREPSTETMFSTSTDGVNWTDPIQLTPSNEQAIDVFPYLYADHEFFDWNVLWLTTAGAPMGRTVELSTIGNYPDDLIARPELTGYTARVLATDTPGIFWGVWVEGPTGQQKLHHRFFAKTP